MALSERPLRRRDPPVVTVTGGSGPPAGADRPTGPAGSPGSDGSGGPAGSGRGGSGLLVVGVLLAAVASLAVLQHEPPAPPPPAEPVEASLRVVGDRISNTRGGVLVVPVEIDNRGPAVRVEQVVVGAEPVRDTPASNGATRVAAGDRARFVAIVEPDCRLLQPGSMVGFVATASVTLRAGDERAAPMVDLGGDPSVVARVTAMCRPS
jgi:hypothetical protein